jgi:4-amino-4-deoxy-L-arabinose transferase-like glycosyltransferase
MQVPRVIQKEVQKIMQPNTQTMEFSGPSSSLPMENERDTEQFRRAFRIALTLAVLALILRLVWGGFVATTVENEGSYYARVGQNLAHGRGYLGIREQGLQLIYPPLFPLLIAAQNFIGVPADIAGRLISALAGAAFVLIAFFLAYRLYGIRVARIAAIIAAIHPLLVVFGAAVLTEMTYLALIWAGVYFVFRTHDQEKFSPALTAGILFGLAYLTRPEAMLLPFISIFWLVVFAKTKRSFAIKQSLALVAIFFVLAAPYVAFLTVETGHVRFEAKTPEGRLFSKMVFDGVPLNQIYHGVDPDLTERGLSMVSNLQVIQRAHFSPREMLVPMIRSAKSNLPRFLEELGGGAYFGNPILFALAMLGIFAMAWNKDQLICQILVVAVSATAILALTSWPFWHERFQFPLCAALVLWGSTGVVVLAKWATLTFRNAGLSETKSAFWSRALVGLAIVVMIGISAFGVRHLDEVSDGWELKPAKEVGLWLRTLSPRPQRVVDIAPTIAFYSGAALTTFPDASPDVALRYLASKNVDTIILRSTATQEPWMEDWIKNGIPDSRAELVARISKPGTIFVIYRFHSEDPSK